MQMLWGEIKAVRDYASQRYHDLANHRLATIAAGIDDELEQCIKRPEFEARMGRLEESFDRR